MNRNRRKRGRARAGQSVRAARRNSVTKVRFFSATKPGVPEKVRMRSKVCNCTWDFNLSGLPYRACLVDKIQVLCGGFREDWSELLHPRQFCDMESSWYVKKTSTGEDFQKSSALFPTGCVNPCTQITTQPGFPSLSNRG